MTTLAGELMPGRLAKCLAVLSFALFWLLPFSPPVSIGALLMTKGTSHWSRRVAVTGAFLCVGYTVVLTFVVVRMAFEIG